MTEADTVAICYIKTHRVHLEVFEAQNGVRWRITRQELRQPVDEPMVFSKEREALDQFQQIVEKVLERERLKIKD